MSQCTWAKIWFPLKVSISLASLNWFECKNMIWIRMMMAENHVVYSACKTWLIIQRYSPILSWNIRMLFSRDTGLLQIFVGREVIQRNLVWKVEELSVLIIHVCDNAVIAVIAYSAELCQLNLTQFQFSRWKLKSSIHIIFHFNNVSFRLTTVVLTMHRQKNCTRSIIAVEPLLLKSRHFSLGQKSPSGSGQQQKLLPN
jgi:hypothetical protein